MFQRGMRLFLKHIAVPPTVPADGGKGDPDCLSSRGRGEPRLCDYRFSCSCLGTALAAVLSRQACRAEGRLGGWDAC